LDQAKQNTEEKVKAITNQAEVVFYRDNDSITTMDDKDKTSIAGWTKYLKSK